MSEELENNNQLTEWDIRLMAWHEAGHAVCSLFLPETEEIESISIEHGNDSFGAMRSAPRRKMNLTYVSCLNEISVAMAGRLSEEMFQKEITSSCVHDLDKIQFIAMRMVSELGMGKRTGMITWMVHSNGKDNLLLFSEKQRNDIYDDIKDIMAEAEKQARQILKEHSKEIGFIAELLLSRKTISGTELSALRTATR